MPPSETLHVAAPPEPVALPAADQLRLVPDTMPCAEPLILSTPMQVAVNVPDPLLPAKSVTLQEKFVHDCAVPPGPGPGSDCAVAHTPPNACAAIVDGLVRLDS